MKEIAMYLGTTCFLIAIICFVLAYKKRKKKENFKKILIIGIGCFVVSAVLATIFKDPVLENITVNDIEVYKDDKAKIILKVTPEDASTDNIQCSVDDETIAYISGNEITGLQEGQTTYGCSYKDDDNEITSNKATINVKLTDDQIAQIEKEKEEQAKQEEERKIAEQQAKEESKNTLSSEEQAFAKNYAIECVKNTLKAPSTAEFPGGLLTPYQDWNMSKSNNLVTVSSYVDAENSFGAMIRSPFTIQMKIDGDTWSVTYYKFGDEIVQGKYQ